MTLLKPAPGYVVVTGSTGGIGTATVQAFLARGHTVVGVDRTAPEDGEEAGLCSGAHPLIDADRFFHVNASLPDDEQVVLEHLQNQPVQHLVAVAGGATPRETALHKTPMLLDCDEYLESLQLNLLATWASLRACWDSLLLADHTNLSVGFTSSINAQRGIGMPAYSSAKAGLSSLAQTLAGPLGEKGIRVNAIAPGTVKTPRTIKQWAGNPKHFETLDSTSALGSVVQPKDIAKAFVALAETLTGVTGQTLTVDAGQTAGFYK